MTNEPTTTTTTTLAAAVTATVNRYFEYLVAEDTTELIGRYCAVDRASGGPIVGPDENYASAAGIDVVMELDEVFGELYPDRQFDSMAVNRALYAALPLLGELCRTA